MTQHEQDLQKLFNSVTVKIPGTETIHAISFNGFKLAVERLMDEAYQHGLQRASAIVDDTLNLAHE